MRVWDVQTGECLRLLGRHKGWVYAVSLSTDGRRALSASDDGTARLWELDWDYEFPVPATWDEGARPYLQSALALSRAAGHKDCGEENVQRLLGVLQAAGYGWLREEGVRAELKRTASRRGRPSWRGRRG